MLRVNAHKPLAELTGAINCVGAEMKDLKKDFSH